MWVQVIKPFIDIQHGRKRRKLHEKWNEKVIRANDLAELGYVVKLSKKKAKNGGS